MVHSRALRHIQAVEIGAQNIGAGFFEALRVRTEKNPRASVLHLTPAIERAIVTAALLHRGQYRKGYRRRIPYLTHPLQVAEILARQGVPEGTIVAGILHDTIEDCEYTPQEMAREFGSRIARVVLEVSEDVELKRAKGARASWMERKEKYLWHLRRASRTALFVCAADKIHNLNSMADSFEILGDRLWNIFSAPEDKRLWFYASAYAILKKRLLHPIVGEVKAALDRVKKLSISGV